MKFYPITLLILAVNGVIYMSAQTQGINNFIAVINVKCEGKYNGSYTAIEIGTGEKDRCQDTLDVDPITQIISYGPNGERSVSTAVRIAGRFPNYPNGATSYYKPLNFVTSGPLQGLYMFNRHGYTRLDYFKICSSVLGRGTILTNDIQIVIADKLDLNVLISNDPYEASKNRSNTICNGYAYIV